MKPYIICHMMTSLDGGLHPSRWTASPDGNRAVWSATYETMHKRFGADGWLVGRVTMAEMSKAGPHAPAGPFEVDRSLHIAKPDAQSFAIAIDPHGKLHFSSGDFDGDHVIVSLGKDVADQHLAELVADGVSYVVSDGDEMDLAGLLETLAREFNIHRLLLEGGAAVNGSFFAAGLVDELSLLMAPAVDARKGSDRFIEFGQDGLAGKCELSLLSCDKLDDGMLHLTYAVKASR
ncbi:MULTISPECIES: RibD family protein [unclassified Rhizobium]|uniref:RibD family protein n=1 Tax=unclassified Rhizobium TaxID=2613769 RepID=UPI001ADAD6EC|nr:MULTISPECIES: RibD family protein [unclassified Rhizobium]MBO9126801.1 RibD family protein [Rhizobium sp. 16-488-2b]MBO9177248.1 RibD family protein [Rhizobium sp. 16-488-2a]